MIRIRRFAFFGFSAAGAIGLSVLLLPKAAPAILGVCCLVLALAGLFLRKAHPAIRYLLLGAALGFLWFSLFDLLTVRPARAAADSGEPVHAVVQDFPTDTTGGIRLTVRLSGRSPFRPKAYVYVYSEDAPAYVPGDEITVSGRISLADTLRGSETDVFTSRGVFLLIRAKDAPAVTGTKSGLRFAPAYARHAVTALIRRIFPPGQAPFMTALLTGDRTELNDDVALTTAMSRSGVSHIVAVSGMHVVFLSTLLSFLIRRRRLCSVVTIPVTLFFMAMTGFTPSVVRAGVMQIALVLAPLFKRERDGVTALSQALLLLLLVNPYAAASVGLQLSFAASLGIILFSSRLYRFLSPRKKQYGRLRRGAVHFVAAGLTTTLSAMVFTLPLSVIYFGTVSLVSPAANLLVLPAVSGAFMLGAVCCVLGFVLPGIAGAAAWIPALLCRYIRLVVTGLSRLGFAALYTTNRAVIVWLIYGYLLLLLFALLRHHRRALALPACAAVLGLCAIFVLTPVVTAGPLTVTALDVGQGQCLTLTDGSYTAVVDCGSSSGENAGDLCGKYLAGRGRSAADLLILTHYHDDHANGVEQLLELVRFSAVVLPDPSLEENGLPDRIIALAQSHGADVIYVTEDLSLSFGNGAIDVLAPIGEATENERGCTILARADDFEILITGDMPEALEKRLLVSYSLPDIEVLVVGHHGSKYASCDDFLDAVTPEEAIISVGYNTYGHPTPEVLDRLASRGISVQRTDLSGNVSVTKW